MDRALNPAIKGQRVSSNLNCGLGPRPDALSLVEGIDLKGKHAIVTGGASGIGVETVRALAVAGAAVTVPARNPAQAETVIAQLRAETGNAAITVEAMDLASLASVRAFAQHFLAKRQPLHLLINNAGIMACPLGRTVDGFELQLGTNHLGHFLLSVLLLPALKSGAPARVVSLASAGHQWSDIDFDDINFERRPYEKMLAYGQSKTANVLFAVEFNRRFAADGITANAVMPGAIATPLGRYMDPSDLFWLDQDGQLKPEFAAAFKTPQQGAATSVWAAVGPELEGIGGLYLENCAVAAPFEEAKAPLGVKPYALNSESATRLWDVSLRLV